jgi:hypothetical protein
MPGGSDDRAAAVSCRRFDAPSELCLTPSAHPVADSFTMALARAYTAQLEQLGHSQRTYDLYRMGFNPVLMAEREEIR